MTIKRVFSVTLAGAAGVALLAAPVAAAPVPGLPQWQPPGLIQPVMGQAVTDKVVARLRDIGGSCSQVPVEYRVDCLRQGLRAAREEIRRRPDYAEASKELNNAARALDKLVKANVDRTKPKIRVRGKVVRAVKTTAAPKVAAAARKIVTESATRLLRSTGSAERQAQVVQIAQAVDSTKVILRS